MVLHKSRRQSLGAFVSISLPILTSNFATKFQIKIHPVHKQMGGRAKEKKAGNNAGTTTTTTTYLVLAANHKEILKQD